LDGTTTYLYAAFATSDFQLHSLLGAVATVQAITIAVAKPVAAKVSDVFGRAEAFALLVVFYVTGYAVVAGSNGIHSYAAGSIIYTVGYASLQIMMQILIGDVTTIRWRTLASSLVSLPFFINFGVASKIAAGVNGSGGWRWGKSTREMARRQS
jgi:MFS family permease